jgi:DnaJ domain
MLGPVNNELPIELVNAVLLALLPVLPVLIVGFTWQSLLALRIRPVFSLHRFESDEITRATILHEDVCRGLKQQRDVGERVAGLWGALFDRRKHCYEIEELEVHAQYLRMTIMRLRHRPLLRLKTWIHIKCAQFAFSGALVTYVVTISLLVVALYVLKQSASAGDYMSSVSDVFVWYPIDERLFYANAVAAGFAALASPFYYIVRWLGLCRQYSLEFCVFKELAKTEPSQLFDQFSAEESSQDQPPQLDDPGTNSDDRNWHTVLGLSESASIEEIRTAYKALIKQNHPDRVHGMSSALRKLADSETKMINAAYRQALHLFALKV